MAHDDTPAVLRGLRKATEPLAVLNHRQRRRLYEYVRARQQPVSRDEVADHAGISARLAAFHLDTLMRKGLLQASYARKPGRGGPGAGRSSKFYRPSDIQIDVSIPERRYDVLGTILLTALEAPQATAARETAQRAAHETGQQLGEQAHQKANTHPLTTACDVLRGYGFEPHTDGNNTLVLTNCPFEPLAQRNPELVCRINHSLIDGILDGLGAHTVSTALKPTPGRCCIALRTEDPRGNHGSVK